MNGRTWLIACLVGVISTLAAIQTQAQEPGVSIRQSVNRTAIFPGDLLIYTLEIDCPPDVDILLDDLDTNRLDLTGLEVLGSDLDRVNSDEGVHYQVHYRLVSYTSESVPMIGERAIRYYFRAAGTRADAAAPERQVVLPAIPLAMRSTLPGEPADLQIRDEVSAVLAGQGTSWPGLTGLLLILLSGLPLAIRGIPLYLARRAAARAARPKIVEPVEPGVLARLASLDVADPALRREGYDSLETHLREALARTLGMSVAALTTAELVERYSAATGEDIRSVLVDCEQARYGKPTDLPSEEHYKAGLSLLRHLSA